MNENKSISTVSESIRYLILISDTLNNLKNLNNNQDLTNCLGYLSNSIEYLKRVKKDLTKSTNFQED